MTINKYVKQWWEESYDVKYEDFYIENARWVLEEPWIKGSIKRAVMMIAFAGGYAFFNMSSPTLLADALYVVAVFAIAQFFYAITDYYENDANGSILYFALLLLGYLTKTHLNPLLTWIIDIIGLAVFVYITFIRPSQLKNQMNDMKRRMKEMEEVEEEADKQSYSKWESAYKSYRYDLPEYDIPTDDPKVLEARKLFEGYTESKDMLKNRYRMLAKSYHPDNGGDEYMFQCISSVYDELQSKLKN